VGEQHPPEQHAASGRGQEQRDARPVAGTHRPNQENEH
jgi:hypothetical protein